MTIMQHDNKHGQKISVKHYLNTNLKSKLRVTITEDGREETMLYPIYVRIKVKGQLTRMKSKISGYYSESEFAYLQRENPISYFDSLIKDIENEKYIITQQILKQKPFDNPNFDINTAVHLNISYWPPYLLDTAINMHMRRRVNAIFHGVGTRIYHNDKEWININEMRYDDWEYKSESDDIGVSKEPIPFLDLGEIVPHTPTGVAATIFLFSHFIQEMRDLRNEYPPSFLQFQHYIDRMKRETAVFGISRELYTIREWVTGEFEEQFMSLIGDSNVLEEIKVGIDRMLMNEPDLAEVFKND